MQTTDSVNRRITKTTKALTTPQSTAKLNIDPALLASLPKGAKFENKQGNATATITIADDGTLEISANCDSLTLLVESLETEVYHLRNANTALKTNTKNEIVVEVNRLSGWQWFQVYGFRIYCLLTILFAGYKIIIKKLKTG